MDHSQKFCARCGRVITWRKKWEHCWDEVKFCSKLCQSKKLSPKDKLIQAEMLSLLERKGSNQPICPSAFVQGLFPADGERFIEAARMAARRLTHLNLAEIIQNGRPVDPSTAKGPIKIRLRPEAKIR